MFNFKETNAYKEAFGERDEVGASNARLYNEPTETVETEPTASTKVKTKTRAKIQNSADIYSYARLFPIGRQILAFLLLLSVIPYSLIFEIRIFWWNYATIPEGLRQPTWGNVENSIIGPLVKFAEDGGARRTGQDLYTTNDLLRLLIHWVVVLGAILFVYGFFNELEVTPENLRVRYAGRWRKVAWQKVTRLRTVELGEGNRLIVLVQMRGWGLSFFHRFYSLLLGAGWQKGIIITSDLKNFDTLVQYLVQYKTNTLKLTPEQSAEVENPAALFVEDGFVSPALQGTLEPSELIDTVIDEFPANLTSAPQLPSPEERVALLPKMLSVAVIVPLLYLVGTILTWVQVTPLILVGAALLLGLGIAEWAFGSLLIYEVGQQFTMLSRFRNVVWAYPYLQGARVVAGVLAFLLTVVFAPGWLVFLVMALACIWGALLTTIFSARLYELGLVKAGLTGAGVILYQIVFLAFYNLIK